MIRAKSPHKNTIVGAGWLGCLLLPVVHAAAVGTVCWLFATASTTLSTQIYRFYRDSGSYLAGPGWLLGCLTVSLLINQRVRHMALVRWIATMSTIVTALGCAMTFYLLWDSIIVRKHPPLLTVCVYIFANVTLQWALGLAIVSTVSAKRLKKQAAMQGRQPSTG